MTILQSELVQPFTAFGAKPLDTSGWGRPRYVEAADLSEPTVETPEPFVTVKTAGRAYFSAPVTALTAAKVFRDCSLRTRATASERRACRTLMRQAAIKWRRHLAMGDL